MTLETLKTINETVERTFNYSFMRYYGDFNELYWVGEQYENSADLEDGSINSTLILTGTTTKDWYNLLKQSEELKTLLDGLKIQTPTGTAGVYSNGGRMIPSDDERVKRYELKFIVYEWKKGK